MLNAKKIREPKPDPESVRVRRIMEAVRTEIRQSVDRASETVQRLSDCVTRAEHIKLVKVPR